MATKIANFRRGDTKHIELSFGEAVDITGHIFKFSLKSKLEDTATALSHTTTAGGADALVGKVKISVPSTLTALLIPGKYYYDIERTIPGDPPDVLTLLPSNPKEQLEVYADVTTP